MLGHLLLRRMSVQRVAQRVDGLLGLRERLATALELGQRPAHATIDDDQQNDARAYAATLRPRMVPLLFDRRRAALALIPLALGVALAVLPNPQTRVLQEARRRAAGARADRPAGAAAPGAGRPRPGADAGGACFVGEAARRASAGG